MPHIESTANARVKEWAGLLEKKQRDRRGKFIVEGIHLVQEALRSDADVECVAYNVELGVPGELAEDARGGAAEWIAVSAAIVAKCTEARTPQPVFAVVRKPAAKLADILRTPNALVAVLDGVQDPGNVGTIIRAADAAGAAGVIVGRGSADIYNPKTVRSTMGSLFHLPIVEAVLTDILPQAREASAKIVSTSLQAERDCYEADYRGATWLLFGSEASGVSPEASAFVDESIIIPMPGRAESLNVAMAASVLLFEAVRQRRM
ncbi:RNA methyltransferase [Saccharibacillus sp. CPCC 101409]|uniref:TrmH family RNA methyltransferase n=1 Tax=Saccharibacillus sp. CPCC 101409 TaxID=3058041 RepID=UPI0026738D8D|nr:RNA methyltransferase [Saccharibacillus sp. CPCC 101409]MDO3410970.1 RNA methyltransferase [Saccharibacillus sp. CPCC 101409]